MRISSVNVGRERPIQNAKPSGKTGIFKEAATGPVRVTSLGLAGDHISDTKNHGGLDQAIYVFGAPDYDWWSDALGHKLAPGAFGDNLTISGFESGGAFIGDRLRIEAVVLEVTAPRIPCVTLAARMEDPTFLKRFRRAERPGVYCRVIREGEVRAGDSVTLKRYDGEKVSAVEVFRDFFDPDVSEATLRRHLAVPIAVRARVVKERQLGELVKQRRVMEAGRPAEAV